VLILKRIGITVQHPSLHRRSWEGRVVASGVAAFTDVVWPGL
jgi:hypothetical protein